MTAAVLVGPPGAGKSTIGRMVAEVLEVPFADTDAIVEQTSGRTISDIFIVDGEETFREMERRAVQEALATHEGVLALGGGAILDERTRADLAAHTVVFLSVGLADAAKRVGLNTARPLLVGSPRRQWQELMQARRPLYLEVADAEVSTAGLSPTQSRDAILAVLEHR
ncbi:shikimate kinase [Pseudactinotalea sp. Z1739]|uniref:shikimate kinase n=1 Tax=Pseudactinotalea sp. Z1739 TaxID=3413028 RepID=UPI003C7B8405